MEYAALQGLLWVMCIKIVETEVTPDEDSKVRVHVQVVVDELDIVDFQIRIDFLNEGSAAPAIDERIVH